MKIIKKTGCALSVLIAVVLFTSCFKDNDNDLPTHIALTTVHYAPETDRGYFFSLDNNKTIHPGDVSRVGNYDARNHDGKRAILYFNLLEQQVAPYDYNAALYSIEDVLTKAVEIAKTPDDVKVFGDKTVDIDNVWISGGYLNFCYYTPNRGYQGVKYRISLVDNQTVTAVEGLPADYVYLEFRCSTEGEDTSNHIKDYASFKLGDYDPAIKGAKGIYLRIHPTDGIPRYIKIEPANSIQ